MLLRLAIGLALLAVLLATPGLLQDGPGGVPVAFRLEISDAPDPWYVSGKPALLNIVAIDQLGRLSPVSGIIAQLKTTDPKSKLNGFGATLANGVAVIELQWFTPGAGHSIEASSSMGLAGQIGGLYVKSLPKGTRFELVSPETWPKYVWAGGVFKFKGKLVSDDGPVGGVEVSFKTSAGAFVCPHEVSTDGDTGFFECDFFAP